ncbi:MAG: hypothetical protein ACRDG7_18875, partial [Candidatus Limnocylindria bacterium]
TDRRGGVAGEHDPRRPAEGADERMADGGTDREEGGQAEIAARRSRDFVVRRGAAAFDNLTLRQHRGQVEGWR